MGSSAHDRLRDSSRAGDALRRPTPVTPLQATTPSGADRPIDVRASDACGATWGQPAPPRSAETGGCRQGLKACFLQARRAPPRPRDASLNPKVEGSNPSRPIATNALVEPKEVVWPPPARRSCTDATDGATCLGLCDVAPRASRPVKGATRPRLALVYARPATTLLRVRLGLTRRGQRSRRRCSVGGRRA